MIKHYKRIKKKINPIFSSLNEGECFIIASEMATAFPIWIAIPRRCRRKTEARLSPVFAAILAPTSCTKSIDWGPKPPRVLQDTGWKTILHTVLYIVSSVYCILSVKTVLYCQFFILLGLKPLTICRNQCTQLTDKMTEGCSQSVRAREVSNDRFTMGPRDQTHAIRPLSVGPRKSGRFRLGRDASRVESTYRII